MAEGVSFAEIRDISAAMEDSAAFIVLEVDVLEVDVEVCDGVKVDVRVTVGVVCGVCVTTAVTVEVSGVVVVGG